MPSDNDLPERNDSESSLDREGSRMFMTTQISRMDFTAARDRLGSSFRNINLGLDMETPPREKRISIGSTTSESRRGSSGSVVSNQRTTGSDRYGPSSRYEQKGMNLVSELQSHSGSELSDADLSDMEGPSAVKITRRKSSFNSKNSKGNNEQGVCLQQTMVIMATLGITLGASFGIGTILLQSRNNNAMSSPQEEQRINAAESVLVSNPSPEEIQAEQRLLEIAESVNTACSDSYLIIDSKACQELCDGRECCLEEEEDSEDYCGNDESMKCPAYVGCKALLEDLEGSIVLDLSEEEEEKEEEEEEEEYVLDVSEEEEEDLDVSEEDEEYELDVSKEEEDVALGDNGTIDITGTRKYKWGRERKL